MFYVLRVDCFALTVLISICHRDPIALSHRRHEPLPGQRNLGFIEALKKISLTVSENLRDHFRNEAPVKKQIRPLRN